MAGPIRASEVASATDKTPEQLQAERAQHAVAQQRARVAGLRKVGALPPSDVAARLERNLRKRENDIIASKARQAVRATLDAKRSTP